MLIEAVEKRFGAVEAIPAGHLLEFLSDNGGAYIAHDTRAVARSLGLTPINTPVCSPAEQRHGRELRQHVQARLRQRAWTSATRHTVMAQLPAAFEHFNEVHPHSTLKMKSPREFSGTGNRAAALRSG